MNRTIHRTCLLVLTLFSVALFHQKKAKQRSPTEITILTPLLRFHFNEMSSQFLFRCVCVCLSLPKKKFG